MLKNNKNKCALDLTESGDMRKVLRKYVPVMSQEDESELLNYCQQNHLVSALPRLFCQCEPEKAKEILLTVLRETQVSISTTSQKQKNALHVASKQNDLEMFEVIFALAFEHNEGWAILSAQDKKGRTPLHTAACNDNTILIDANHKAAHKIGRLLELQTIKDNESKTAGDLENP